jgi:hypothetical protein
MITYFSLPKNIKDKITEYQVRLSFKRRVNHQLPPTPSAPKTLKPCSPLKSSPISCPANQ